MLAMTRAVEHAHGHGLIHRDLKPSNVLVGRQGRPHIVELGLAKLAQHDGQLTVSSTLLGKRSYLTSEPVAAGACRRRSSAASSKSSRFPSNAPGFGSNLICG